MNTFSGKGKVGLLAAFAVLLMPLLGIGTASAYEVGDTVTLDVPDLQQLANPDGLEARQFTCRAITEHAVWLVQDTSWIGYFGSNKPSGRLEIPQMVWGDNDTTNLLKPAEFTVLTEMFENDVWETVTAICGEPADVNNDDKILIVLASMPTIWSPMGNEDSKALRGDMYTANPEYFNIDGVETDVFYLNIHPYSTHPPYAVKREYIRQWNLADGLAALSVYSNQSEQEEWLVRGIATGMQYECFGLTSVAFGPIKRGVLNTVGAFAKQPYKALNNRLAANQAHGYQIGRGQGFMFTQYLKQTYGDGVVGEIARNSEDVGLLTIARIIDETATEETMYNVVAQVFNNFQLALVRNDLHSPLEDGIYQFDFLDGTDLEDWRITNAGFTLKPNSYPMPDMTSELGAAMNDRVLCSQFVRLEDLDEADSKRFYINCQYTDGMGSNGALESTWQVWAINVNEESEQMTSVEVVELDASMNGSYEFQGTSGYFVITNGSIECPANLRYYVTQNTEIFSVENAVHQNTLATQMLTIYTSLFSNVEDDYAMFDWYGPIFTATIDDSVLNVKMSTFTTDLYTAEFSAWQQGNYKLEIGGYTPAGFEVASEIDLAVGFADTDLLLELSEATLEVPRGGAASGSMVTLVETGALDLSMESSNSLDITRNQMTGVVAGPVRMSNATGTLSFTSTTNSAVVYRYTLDGWVEMPSYRQNGQTSAAVSEGGIYVLGEGIGAFAPELPASVILTGNAPNPFSAQTAISFGLPASGNVTVNVFDMTGRLVNTLASQDMAAANHTLIWDGTDSSGFEVGAGVYFCRLETAGQVLTQKMLKVQ